ncbi:MAG: GspE/PulE family protein, partial [Nitrospinota bacterium]
ATLPTFGNNEDAVLRILAASKPLPLDKLNLSEKNIALFSEIIQKPYGIFLVVGPTGSGKTTTLHSALGHINKPNKKIWTAEDPVEITQPGLRQVQIRSSIDLTFANALRAFLRADPDVIMIGEMRDRETVGMGVEASLTGHLVFSTLHTNSASETVIRLIDLGVDPFSFADALLGILAQRLVKTLCSNCKEKYTPSSREIEVFKKEVGPEFWGELERVLSQKQICRPKGCPKCHQTGFKGRTGLHEMLTVSEELRHCIQNKGTSDEIRKIAVAEGMRTLKQDGILKVLMGYTTIEKVRTVCSI